MLKRAWHHTCLWCKDMVPHTETIAHAYYLSLVFAEEHHHVPIAAGICLVALLIAAAAEGKGK